MIEIRGSSEGDLAPDHEKRVSGNIEQQWDLDAYRSGKLLLRCHYKNSKETITREIPASLHHCTKTYRPDAHGMPVDIPRMICN